MTAAADLGRTPDVGFAPPGWTALTNHLSRAGASDEEIVGAGLGTHASTGRVIDRFRDRLMFPIKDGQEIHGFIGRRNPNTDGAENPPPKYLNTPETDLFHKREALYGLTAGTETLPHDAGLVLVEGPLDAWAVNLATLGRYVGVAPLGTAFTDAQADKVAHHLAPERPPVIVATDNDTAGRQAAERAYWQFALRGADPQRLQLPMGLDPAQLLQTQGPQALRDGLDTPTSLARTLIDQHLNEFGAVGSEQAEIAAAATQHALAIIAATPADQAPGHLAHLVPRAGLDVDQTAAALVSARSVWRADPANAARAALSAPRPLRQHDSADSADAKRTEDLDRWHELAARTHPRLASDPGWEALAAVLDRAQKAGHDVETNFPRLAADPPLPEKGAAQEMEYRMVSEYPDSALHPLRARHQLATPSVRPPEPRIGPRQPAGPTPPTP
jgi:DNA primase